MPEVSLLSIKDARTFSWPRWVIISPLFMTVKLDTQFSYFSQFVRNKTVADSAADSERLPLVIAARRVQARFTAAAAPRRRYAAHPGRMNDYIV